MAQAVRCLGIRGRAAIVALSRAAVSFHPYTELINKETEMTGVLRSSRVPSFRRLCETRRAGNSPFLSRRCAVSISTAAQNLS